jgi:hypothetical protein
MADWTSGYVSEIEYTYGYYKELNPNLARFALLRNGVPFPVVRTACELGYGQGVSTNIHAAANGTKWYGTDFNPSQASFAQELSSVSKNNSQLYDEAFDEFCSRDDLPNFDFIGIHGIWSWISNENRKVIVDFIRRKLNVGGVVYISYNAMPGWAQFAPLRELMAQHAHSIGSGGQGIVNRIDGSIDFAERLLSTKPTYLSVNPQIAQKLTSIKGQEKQYLAHEYFNRDWEPMNFSTLAKQLEAGKLGFACSANYLSHVDTINLTPEQIEFMAEINDTIMRQSVRDIMTNQQFRQDYWVKGLRKSPHFDQIRSLKAERVILTTIRPDIPQKVACPFGEATLNEQVYSTVLDVLEDYKLHTVSEIVRLAEDKNILMSQITEALLILSHMGHVMIAAQEEPSDTTIDSCRRLNDHILNLASSSGFSQIVLASPVTGGGIIVSRLHQLFLLAVHNGLKTASELADFTWKIFDSQGEKIIKDGETLEDPAQNISFLENSAHEFIEKRLQILTNLRILEVA